MVIKFEIGICEDQKKWKRPPSKSSKNFYGDPSKRQISKSKVTKNHESPKKKPEPDVNKKNSNENNNKPQEFFSIVKQALTVHIEKNRLGK